MGIPTAIITRHGFTPVVANALGGMGFPIEAPVITEFPVTMMLPGGDQTPLRESIDKVIYGITKWRPKITAKGIFTPPKLTVTGKDYEEAVANTNYLFYKNLWSDGLPLLPPTEERVNWILTGTDLPRDTIVGEGKIQTRGGICTVEGVAVCLAMAGGRPEYMPVLIAATDAMLDPLSQHGLMNATTCSGAPAVIVNGPVAKEIRVNSGYSCLGPSSEYPAGATIGRAMRFMLVAMGGGIPGQGSMAIYGGGFRYTNIVFAEDEDGLPKDWNPVSVEQGFPKGSNVVTVLAGIASQINLNGVRCLTEETAIKSMNSIGGSMKQAGNWDYVGPPGILLLARYAIQPLSDLGWTRKRVQEELWERSKVPVVDLGNYNEGQVEESPGLTGCTDPIPITSKPENIMIVCCGGEQSGHGEWMQVGHDPKAFVSREIKLPAKAKWDALLAQAETDLGPLPVAVHIG